MKNTKQPKHYAILTLKFYPRSAAGRKVSQSNDWLTINILDKMHVMQEMNSFLDSELVRRARQWKQLKKLLDRALPLEFAQRVSYASLKDNKLTIFSDAPEWTSRMRFYSAEIIEFFAQEGISVNDVQARTVPNPDVRPPSGDGS